ncbi:MAG: hypothetical protein V4488_02120 [Pseudomonadota bacterium]
MKRFALRYAILPIALMIACNIVYAQPQAAIRSAPPVTISSMRDPVDKSYRKMLKGMELFEKLHGMAPTATLRYKLLPRRPDTNMDGIVLKIVGDSITIPVPIAPDHTFILQRNDKALREDAAVIPNRKAGSMTWRTEIRTPGLPPNTRRLGDLRLECRVGLEADLVSNDPPLIGQLASLVRGLTGYCDAAEPQYLFFSERPLFSVTLTAGGRSEILSVDQLYAGISRHPISESELSYCDCQVLLDRTYFLPLGDRSWPDDTLVRLEYMDDSAVTHQSLEAVPSAAPRASKEAR